MTIEISRLNLRLPQGFESRADTIAHRIGAELDKRNWSRDVRMDHLKLPPVSVSPHEGDGAVARKVADAILREIEGRLN